MIQVAAGHVVIVGFGMSGAVVYCCPDEDAARTCLHLAALLYASEEAKRSGRERAS